jgi:hypothetical protein
MESLLRPGEESDQQFVVIKVSENSGLDNYHSMINKHLGGIWMLTQNESQLARELMDSLWRAASNPFTNYPPTI